MADEDSYSFKILLVGDSGVGKSSLLLRFTEDTFDQDIGATIGVDFKVKNITVPYEGRDRRLNLKIWDTAGQERFRTLTSSYYRGAHGVILVYDITERQTFENVERWLKEIDTFKSFADVRKMLVGNKLDLAQVGGGRVVDRDEGRSLAQEHGMMFFECSAKTRDGVLQAFAELGTKILETSSLRDTVRSSRSAGVQLGERPAKDTAAAGCYC
eukprot:TRINITY_DN442_c6_g2_i7.p1 TRINITY_DN442_c6_g2~~TRINITY_DN442_c6_g2_i7.p1  ORF type:complete len:213 (+),score=58.89 TRINITY_DN442_c6_g2_i7:105-743(+)